mmetsp:Transcript_5571/g.23547  ORF Transcript_5571/g.23547 Transcript_5571/m.23547 type:complete len:232 (+) Transcript_5571:670-1365(+)
MWSPTYKIWLPPLTPSMACKCLYEPPWYARGGCFLSRLSPDEKLASPAKGASSASDAPMGVMGAPSSVFRKSLVFTSTSNIAARSFSKKPGLQLPVITASNKFIHSTVFASPRWSATRKFITTFVKSHSELVSKNTFLPEALNARNMGTNASSAWMYLPGSSATARFKVPSLWHRSTEARISSYIFSKGLHASARRRRSASSSSFGSDSSSFSFSSSSSSVSSSRRYRSFS